MLRMQELPRWALMLPWCLVSPDKVHDWDADYQDNDVYPDGQRKALRDERDEPKLWDDRANYLKGRQNDECADTVALDLYIFSEAYGIGIKQSNTGRYYCGGENYAVYIHKPRDAESLYYIEIRNLSLSHAGHAVKHGKYDHAEHDNIQ